MGQKIDNRSPFFCENTVEVRSIEGQDGAVSGYVVRGYAALFNVRSREMRSYRGKRFVEVISPGAFDKADFSDLECRFQHSRFIAAVPTLRYGIDARGFWYEYDHDPEDPDHVSVLRKIQRGDCKGSSFMFDEPLETDQEVVLEGNVAVRTIKVFRKVWDCGPVLRPAYRQTTATAFARSLDDLEVWNDSDHLQDVEERDMSGVYDANTDPSEGQKEAGNYRKGRVKVAGMVIRVENPKGTLRSGLDSNGVAWSSLMTAHYGYLLGVKADDGDDLDVFLTDEAETARVVFVVDQINSDGSFDEHKCLIGPVSEEEARALYLAHYPAGWSGLGAICCVPMECFRAWVMDGKKKKNPLMYSVPALAPAGDVEERSLEIENEPGDDGKNVAIERRKMEVRATLM